MSNFDTKISDGQVIYEDFHHSFLEIEKEEQVELTNSEAFQLIEYLSNRTSNSEFKARFALIVLGLIFVLMSAFKLFRVYYLSKEHTVKVSDD